MYRGWQFLKFLGMLGSAISRVGEEFTAVCAALKINREEATENHMTNIVYWEDLDVGHVEWGTEVVVSKNEMLDYARKYDPWPFHVDEEAAARTPFGGLIASGGYTISLFYLSGQGVWNYEGRPWAFLGGFDWKLNFLLPVRARDRLRLKWTLKEKRPSSKPSRGHWLGFSELINQDDKASLSIEAMFLMATRPEATS